MITEICRSLLLVSAVFYPAGLVSTTDKLLVLHRAMKLELAKF